MSKGRKRIRCVGRRPLKSPQWKKSRNGYTHGTIYTLECDCYCAEVYEVNGRWGAEIEGPKWNNIKHYKPIYKEKEAAQDRAVGHILSDLDRRHAEMFFLIEALEHL